ncbi:MAG: hypothetical protein IT365_23005 [Candidatus Hydrogenedentes bacterium]|nr:hypothetical protein [Candidatus Hydrogenedentota bacterium]
MRLGARTKGAAMLCALWASAGLVGCHPESTAPVQEDAVHGENGHVHHHAAPHGGTLVALGEHVAHIELVLEPEEGYLTAYVLDGEAEHAVRIAARNISVEISIEGKPSQTLDLFAVSNPLTGETEGDTSEFSGQSDALKGLARFSGSVGKVTVRGIDFDGVAFSYPEGNEE